MSFMMRNDMNFALVAMVGTNNTELYNHSYSNSSSLMNNSINGSSSSLESSYILENEVGS